MSKFTGVYTALATPFLKGQVDLDSFKKLLDHQLDGNVQGLVVNGTTAESPCLSSQEVVSLFEATRKVVGPDFPLVVGTGSNSTAKTIEQTQTAQELGADAALVVTPYYNKPTQEGLRQHFLAVAQSTSIPVILYNVPARTVTRIENETLLALSQVKNIVGVKDATGDMAFGATTIKQVSSDFFVSSGDDDSFIDLTLMGGQGVTSVLSNLCPKQVVSLYGRARQEDKSCLQDYKSGFGSLLEALGGAPNPVPIKQALFEVGIFKSPEVRLPLVPMTSPQVEKLSKSLKDGDFYPSRSSKG